MYLNFMCGHCPKMHHQSLSCLCDSPKHTSVHP